MKKLLLILLLFFPFHGAWAESLMIRCTPLPKGSGSSVLSLIMDNTVLGSGGNITGVEVSKTNYMIYWKSSKHIEEGMKKLYPSYKFTKTQLDRVTGEMTVIHYHTNNKQIVHYYLCDKETEKKKF